MQYIYRILCFGVLALLSASPALTQTTFTVTNTDDAGNGSLRQAIEDANANAGADVIEFNIPGAGPHVIQPASALPLVTEAVTLDGFTQPEATPNTNALWEPSNADLRIVLDGSSAGQANGLVIQSSNSVVRGLVIGGFEFHGLLFENGNGGHVEGCYIGTDVTGTQDRGNAFSGIWLRNAQATIGGPDPEDRNVISGNDAQGILIYGAGAGASVVQGNYVGTDANGAVALGNGFEGIFTGSTALFNDPDPSEATGVLLGGSGPGEGNLVSGNGRFGIGLFGRSNDGPTVSLNTRVEGNRVGTNVAGTMALGNTLAGILARAEVTDVTVGGSTPEAGNLTSGNGFQGILIELSEGVVVENNLVGTDASGTQPLGNEQTGLLLFCSRGAVARSNVIAATVLGGGIGLTCTVEEQSTDSNIIAGNWVGTDRAETADLGNWGGGVVVSRQASGNVIGGETEVEANIIAYNNGPGVIVRSNITGPATIQRNRIYANAALGIDLEPAGLTENDSGDGDTGANSLQNFPVITEALITNSVLINGTLNSTPATDFQVEFFAGAACDPIGHGEGETFLGAETVTTDADGEATFSATLDAELETGHFITATATDPNGNTSEFSACFEIITGVAVEDTTAVPTELALEQNYPNPFNPTTQVAFSLPKPNHVRLAVYDLLGREVAVLADEQFPAGTYEATFEAAGLPGGIYVYQLHTVQQTLSKKMILVK